MLLLELFTQPVPYIWKNVGNSKYEAYQADFRVDGIKYQAEFVQSRGIGLRFACGFHAFDEDDEPTIDIIGNGKQFPVFATVVTIIKEFIAQHQPDLIMFTADEPSRRKLYRRLLSTISVPGYTFDDRFAGIFEIIKVPQ